MASNRELIVLMNGQRLGALSKNAHGRTRLDYDDEYLSSPRPTPLSASMPLTAPSWQGKRLHAWLQGLLPDNSMVIERWAARFGVSPDSPFALLSHVGEDTAGAVQFVRPERMADLVPGGVTWLDDETLRARVELLRVDPATWLDADGRGQFSLAGAQSKFALLFEDRRWGEPYGAVPTTHIIKPPAGRFEDQDLNEHLCLQAAANVGLVVARSQIVFFGDERATAVERYDRIRTETGWRRIHQEDCCQALGIPPDRKYQSQGGPGTDTIARLLRGTVVGTPGDQAVSDFVDALAFNWLAGGTDAHAKNFSLLLSGSQVRLAPLYDLTSALPYVVGPQVRVAPGQLRGNAEMAMKVGDNKELAMIRREDWSTLSTQCGLDPDTVLARVDELASRVPDAFADAAAADDVVACQSPLPERLVTKARENVNRCRSALAGRPARRHRR